MKPTSTLEYTKAAATFTVVVQKHHVGVGNTTAQPAQEVITDTRI